MEGLKVKKGTRLNTLGGGVSRLGTLFGVAAMLVLVTGCPQTGGGGDGDGKPECTADTVAADCTGGAPCQTAACTDDKCVYTDGCDAEHCVDGACVTCIDAAECDDSNACTDDACTDGACENTNNSDACDDGDDCTEGDACAAGACAAGTAMDCGDDDLCTDDVCTDGTCSNPDKCAADETCDPADGACTAVPVGGADLVADNPDVDFDALEVNDIITLTAPLPEGAAPRQVVTCDDCLWTVDPQAAGTFDPTDDCVSDFTVATDGDFTISVVVTCDDGTETTFNQAGTVAEPSVVLCNVDADCDDGSECTTNTCVTNECIDEDVDCDDGLVCTEDTCDAATGCANDENVCEEGFACRESTGTGECEELTPCTVAGECDDGLFCNGEEACVDLFCADGTPPCVDDETCDEGLQDCLIGGETFNFTTVTGEALIGTSGDDTFRGVTGTTATATLTAGDSANGGAGNDDLIIFLTDADLSAGITMDNIEQIFAQNTTTTARSVSTLGWTNVDELWTNASLGAVTYTGMTSVMDAGLKDTDQNLTLTFNNTAFTSITDQVNVFLSDSTATTGATVVIGSTNNTDGVETIVIDSGGTGSNRIASIDDSGPNDFVTLNFTGDQDCRVDAIGSSVKTIDASELTGKLNVSVAGLSGLTFTGTAQDDTIRGSTLGATDTIDGGDGTDALELTGTLATGTTLTAVESLTLKPSTATISFDLDNGQDITAVQITPSAALTDISGTKLPPSTTITTTSNLQMELKATANSVFTLDTPGGGADTLNFVFEGNGALIIGATNAPSFTGFENVSFALNNSGGATFTTGILDTANTIAKVTLTGGQAANVSGAAMCNSTSFVTLDGSGLTGKLTTAAATFPTQGATVSGGAGNDAIVVGNFVNTINGNGGNDTITGGTNVDTVFGGDGNDIITGGATAAANKGLDVFTGDAGSDDFVIPTSTTLAFAGGSAITVKDFVNGTDNIDYNGATADVSALTGSVAWGAAGSIDTHSSTGNITTSLTAKLVIITVENASAPLSTDGADVLGALVTGAGAGTITVAAAGDVLLFAVSDGTDTGIYLGAPGGADTNIAQSELVLIATLSNHTMSGLTVGDFK